MPKPKRVRATSNPLGAKINEVMAEKGMNGDYAAVAKQFGVAVPSVYGWIDNGRIDKSRLSSLASWSGKPVTWWLDTTGNISAGPVHDALADWRHQASPRALQVIDQLTTAAQGRQLDDEAWQLIGLMARRLAANAPHLGQGAPEAPARVKPEYQAELDQAVRSAEERRDHEQEQPKPRQRRTVSGQ
jgi:hypothetical protein